MSSKGPEIETKFWIQGDELNPDEFTNLIGIQPYRVGKKGQLSSHPAAANHGVVDRETFWVIEVEHKSYSMNEGIQGIVAQVWPHRDKILEYVGTRPSVEMGVTSVIHVYQDRPVYDISVDSVRKLAGLGCSFMIDDIYRLEETED